MNTNTATRILQIHVSTTLLMEDLHHDDTAIVGIYEAEVGADLSDGLAAWAALQAFHEKTGIERPDDFSCEVFDPESGTYIQQEDPDAGDDNDQEHTNDEKGIYYSFNGRLADEVSTKLRLTLDVSYFTGGLSVETLTRMLNRMVEEGIGNGMLTGSSSAQVLEHSYEVLHVLDEPEALTPDHPEESRTDYILSDKVKGCWISVDTANVHVMRTHEGVIVDISPTGSIETVSSAHATFGELEEEICDAQNVAIEDVQIQHDFAHPDGPIFDSLPPVRRAEVIEQVAKVTAKAVAAYAKTVGDHDSDETNSLQLAQMFSASPLV